MTFTRRRILELGLTASAALLSGCGGGGGNTEGAQTTVATSPTSSSSGTTPSSDVLDAVVIGAGAAGIGAGRVLAGQQKRFVILDARDRIGGRCYCDNTTFPGIAFDVGGQWLHQVTPVPGTDETTNPLYDIAIRSGVTPVLDDGPRFLYPPGRNIFDTDAAVTLGEVLGVLGIAGTDGYLDPSKDVSIATATASLAGEPFYDICTGLILPGARTDLVSCADGVPLGFTGSPVLTPTLDNYLVPSGLGNLLASLATGLPFRLNTKVTGIAWGSGGVALDTNTGTIRARTVIITIPVSVLNAGAVAFSPALPANIQSALAGIRLTEVAKVALLFDRDVFGVATDNTFVIPTGRPQPLVLAQIRGFGRNYAIVIPGGAGVADLEKNGHLVDFALSVLRRIFPQATRDRLIASTASQWNTDPLSLGNFSYALAGSQPSRVTLQTPVNNQLFFAGEAISESNHSSVHGAYISGQKAAQRVLAGV